MFIIKTKGQEYLPALAHDVLDCNQA